MVEDYKCGQCHEPLIDGDFVFATKGNLLHRLSTPREDFLAEKTGCNRSYSNMILSSGGSVRGYYGVFYHGKFYSERDVSALLGEGKCETIDLPNKKGVRIKGSLEGLEKFASIDPSELE